MYSAHCSINSCSVASTEFGNSVSWICLMKASRWCATSVVWAENLSRDCNRIENDNKILWNVCISQGSEWNLNAICLDWRKKVSSGITKLLYKIFSWESISDIHTVSYSRYESAEVPLFQSKISLTLNFIPEWITHNSLLYPLVMRIK